MKTLQEQYNLIKEGKGNKEQFFKSARYLFPDMITPVNTFEDTVRILKNRGIIAEGIGGVATTGKKQDWHAIFNENMEKLKEKKDDEDEDEEEDDDKKYKEKIDQYEKREKDIEKFGLQHLKHLREAKKAKNEEEPSKEVLDKQKHAYNNKDTKNYDNVFGQEFLKGYYTEMKDPKNADKDVEELRAIVAKNLAKDMNYYVKDGQFGVKGLGYITDAPGLGESKPATGKHKSSGYGDLKESVLRSQIYLLVKEVLTELQPEPNADKEQFSDMVAAKLKGNNEALKYLNQNETNIVDTFLDHSKPNGGVDGAVAHVLKQVKAAPLSEKKKPSTGLTKKEKSAISKKAHAGKDIGKKGKGFEKVAKAAEKEYGSKEAGEKVAAAAMWKSQAAKKG
jgi:hypothetical protein